MLMSRSKYMFALILAGFAIIAGACKKDEPVITLQLINVRVGNLHLMPGQTTSNIPRNAEFIIEFASAIDTASVRKAIVIKQIQPSQVVQYTYQFSGEFRNLIIKLVNALNPLTDYILVIGKELKGAGRESFPGVEYSFRTEPSALTLSALSINGQNFMSGNTPRNIRFDQISIEATFSDSLNLTNPNSMFYTYPPVQWAITWTADRKTITLTNTAPLDYYAKYNFFISSDLTAVNGSVFQGFMNSFITGLNPAPKMPPISDEALLDLVQYQTFRYFWDFAHPASGMARERNSSGNVVTTGGSGFGIMAVIVGVERGFITRAMAMERFSTLVDFLGQADRFHGAWPHWLHGVTGKTIPFSTKDNGGDLVETSFMAAGLLTLRQYLDPNVQAEQVLINKINTLLQSIEWSWYTRGGQNVLYWHWSPNYGWDMNMQVRGYNEALITYFMAATSTTYPINASVYHQGWAGTPSFINGKTFYGITLPLGYDYGGPLFFAHYSFLGLDPRNLSDQYANYWTQNRNHTLINYNHCVINPFGKTGYSAECWGLTASDDPGGYAVHEPTSWRDNGTISPTAALSSFPFTPEESFAALRHFYFVLGDKLWGEYGFYDAFNPHVGWWANSYLAIDQGPIIIMMENHRSGLIWNLFMSAPEVQLAMNKLGFTR